MELADANETDITNLNRGGGYSPRFGSHKEWPKAGCAIAS